MRAVQAVEVPEKWLFGIFIYSGTRVVADGFRTFFKNELIGAALERPVDYA